MLISLLISLLLNLGLLNSPEQWDTLSPAQKADLESKIIIEEIEQA
jgi:hypothetical protein